MSAGEMPAQSSGQSVRPIHLSKQPVNAPQFVDCVIDEYVGVSQTPNEYRGQHGIELCTLLSIPADLAIQMFDMCQCPSFRDRAIEHAGEFFIGHPDLWHETPCGYALR